MNRLATAIAVVALATGVGAGARARDDAPVRGPVVILFGARWCAPCRAELGRLDALAAAARPAEVAVAWLDAEPALDRLPPGVRIIPQAAAERLFDALASDAAGLPHAVLVDRRGTVCAHYPGPVDPARIEALLRGCGWR